MPALLLGIDVGTSSTKAVIVDAGGAVVAAASAGHPISRPRPGWSEQDPRDWWASSLAAVKEALSKAGAAGGDIAAIGLSGQMHGAVFLDGAAADSGGRDGRALRPAILWNDQRTGEECREIEDRCGGRAEVVRLVGNAPLTGFTLPKILWVRRHEPDVFARTRAILLPKDYLRFRLSGDLASDVGDSSGTLLLDVDRRDWSRRMLALMDLDASLLPRLVEPTAITGAVSPWAAEQTGLRAATPIVGGSGDSQAGGVGAGVVRPGLALAAIGTSGVIYAHSPRPLKDTAGCGPGGIPGCVHTKCAATGSPPPSGAPGEWCITGCTLSAGGSLEWARDLLMPGASFDQVSAEAARAPRGSGGLLFLPYLTGERCPHPDPEARGAWIGLTARHTRAHLLRAVVEGVTFTMRQVLDIIIALGVRVERVRLGGGGARAELWRRMQADVYELPVALPNTEEGPAFGAALLAGVGAGFFKSVAAACDAAIREQGVIQPDRRAADEYRPFQEIHGRLYADLQDRLHALTAADSSAQS
jgi:xylulokinase